jgi:hypothetical protein
VTIAYQLPGHDRAQDAMQHRLLALEDAGEVGDELTVHVAEGGDEIVLAGGGNDRLRFLVVNWTPSPVRTAVLPTTVWA